jgi:hypothetical protein
VRISGRIIRADSLRNYQDNKDLYADLLAEVNNDIKCDDTLFSKRVL